MKRTRVYRDLALAAAVVLFAVNFLKPSPKHDFHLKPIMEKTIEFTQKMNEAFLIYQDSCNDTHSHFQLNLIDTFLSSVRAGELFEPNMAPSADYLNFLDNIILAIRNSHDKFSFENMLRIKKTGEYFEFIADRTQFHESLFDKDITKWKGDIISDKDQNYYYLYDIYNKKTVDSVYVTQINSRLNLQSTSNLIFQVIPANITKQNLPEILVTNETNEESKENSSNFILLDNTTLTPKNSEYIHVKSRNRIEQGVYSILPGDYMIKFNTNENRWYYFSNTDQKYFAKQLWLNGKDDVYYPLGADLLWAKNCYDHFSINLDTSGASKRFISLNYDLQQRIAEVVSMERLFRPARESFPEAASYVQNFISSNWTGKKYRGVFTIEGDNKIVVDWTKLKDLQEFLGEEINDINTSLGKMSNDQFEKNRFVNERLNLAINGSYSMNFICADGEGRIRVLYDKKGNVLPINPNDHKMVNNIKLDLAQYFTYEREKNYWGNLNLMNQSPGSTFKPIVYTSVGSQLKNELWSHLIFPSNEINNQSPLNYFAGVDMSSPLNDKNGWNDLADHKGAIVTPEQYLIFSRNIYNAIVLYLGSFKRNVLIENLKNTQSPVLIPLRADDKRKELFPIVQIDGNNYSFSTQPDQRPGNKSGWFVDDQSILGKGLSYYFSVVKAAQSTPANVFDASRSSWTGNPKNIKTSFALPELPYLIFRDREGVNAHGINPRDKIFQGIKQCAQGATPIKMSPLVMAQNYLRIFEASDNINLNFDTSKYQMQKGLSASAIDPAYGNDDHFVNEFLKPRVFEPLGKVITEGTFRSYRNAVLNIPELQNYHFYAKTATIGTQGGRKNKSLALIISRANLMNVETADSLRKNKIMVCYFTFHNATREGGEGGTWPAFSLSVMKNILSELAKSNVFRKYFEK
jgi:hypothetical protein